MMDDPDSIQSPSKQFPLRIAPQGVPFFCIVPTERHRRFFAKGNDAMTLRFPVVCADYSSQTFIDFFRSQYFRTCSSMKQLFIK